VGIIEQVVGLEASNQIEQLSLFNNVSLEDRIL
jgi:hypothetical protein